MIERDIPCLDNPYQQYTIKRSCYPQNMTQKTQIDSSTCCWPHEQKVASFSWIQNHPIFQSLTWHVTIKFYLYTWIFEPPKHEKTDSQRVSLRKCQDSATQQTQDAAWQMFALAWATWSRSLYAWWVNGSSSSRIGSSAIQKTPLCWWQPCCATRMFLFTSHCSAAGHGHANSSGKATQKPLHPHSR